VNEFDQITVRFYPAGQGLTTADLSNDTFLNGNAREFDDRAAAKETVVRVVVSWQYPLVIPFVDRVIFVASGRGSTAGNKPAWAVGTHLYQTQSGPFRIPLFASYVMRMQWDARST